MVSVTTMDENISVQSQAGHQGSGQGENSKIFLVERLLWPDNILTKVPGGTCSKCDIIYSRNLKI